MTVPTQFFKLKYIRMTEIEFFTDRFHYYIDSIEFLSNRIYGTDYQSRFNRKYQQSFTNTDFNKGELGTLFDEHPIYVEYLNELNHFSNPSENDRFEVICNYKSIAYDEMLRLQSVLIKEKNEYKMKWLQWMLLRKRELKDRVPLNPIIEKYTTRFYITEEDYQELKSTPKADLHIQVVPKKGKHPAGIYNIPREEALNFIKAKRTGFNWEKHQNFKQDSVPSALKPYFWEAPDGLDNY